MFIDSGPEGQKLLFHLSRGVRVINNWVPGALIMAIVCAPGFGLKV